MSSLIVTEEEQKMTWREAPDKLLADIMRQIMIITGKIDKNEDPDVTEAMTASDVGGLIRLAISTNSNKVTIVVKGFSEGDVDLGDFEITARKLT